MVATGEATVAQIDAAITTGPGLRWPIMGPCLTFHLAGGPAAWRICSTISARARGALDATAGAAADAGAARSHGRRLCGRGRRALPWTWCASAMPSWWRS